MTASEVPLGGTQVVRSYGAERLAALTDGVFAITLTLLVLDLKIPEVPAGAEQVLREDLLAMVPNAVAWVVSFVLIARFWMIHHEVLATLARVHLSTIVFNFAVLLLVSVMPFATALIGTYEFEVAPVVIFSTVMAATGVAIGLFAGHVARHPAMKDPGVRPLLRWHALYHSVGITCFAVFAIVMSLRAHPLLPLAAWLVEPVIAYTLTRRRA